MYVTVIYRAGIVYGTQKIFFERKGQCSWSFMQKFIVGRWRASTHFTQFLQNIILVIAVDRFFYSGRNYSLLLIYIDFSHWTQYCGNLWFNRNFIINTKLFIRCILCHCTYQQCFIYIILIFPEIFSRYIFQPDPLNREEFLWFWCPATVTKILSSGISRIFSRRTLITHINTHAQNRFEFNM